MSGETIMKRGPYLLWGLLGATAIVGSAVYLGGSTYATTEEAVDGHKFKTSAILGGRQHINEFESFVGGEVSAFMGGVELDFSGSTMSGDETELELFVVMGGIDLRIPSDWVVVDRAAIVMGGIEDQTRVPDGAIAKRLVLRGSVFMGGLHIRN
jgi:hypothetical protein